MLRWKKGAVLTAIVFLGAATGAQAQTRTTWTMHEGAAEQDMPPGCAPTVHGEACEFGGIKIPAENDPGWKPAFNVDTIAMGRRSAVSVCQRKVDYTYFQLFVEVPAGTAVKTLTIDLAGMDDGVKVFVFDATGAQHEGAHATIGQTKTADLAKYIKTGRNRIVIAQVDDCPVENNLTKASVVFNGAVLPRECPALPFPTKGTYRENAPYKANDIVLANGEAYRCKPYPSTLYCQQGFYTPSKPDAQKSWQEAWVGLGPCATAAGATVAPYQPGVCPKQQGAKSFQGEYMPEGAYLPGDVVTVLGVAYACKAGQTAVYCKDPQWGPGPDPFPADPALRYQAQPNWVQAWDRLGACN